MSANPHGLTVGQTLYWVPSDLRWGKPKNVQVEKIGRRWAALSTGRRIDVETMWADGGEFSSPGMCWMSKEAYEAHHARALAWGRLATALRNLSPPAGVTADDIAAARKLLRLDPEAA